MMPAARPREGWTRRWLLLLVYLACAAAGGLLVLLVFPRARTVDVFFVQTDPAGHSATLISVHRPASSRGAEDRLRTALQALLAGPSSAEKRRGVISEIPIGTALRGLRIEGRVVTVDLSQEFARGGGSTSMLGRVWQVVYTATQSRDAPAAQILLEGRHVETLGGEGLLIGRPLRRPPSPPTF